MQLKQLVTNENYFILSLEVISLQTYEIITEMRPTKFYGTKSLF